MNIFTKLFGKNKPPSSEGDIIYSIEEALYNIDAIEPESDFFQLPISDKITFQGKPDSNNIGFQELLYKAKCKGFEPDGYEIRRGYRLNKFRKNNFAKSIDITKWNPSLLKEAVFVWTGRGEKPFPDRDDKRIIERFGSESGNELIEALHYLESEFYSSEAHQVANDLSEMARISSSQFIDKFPELSEEIAEAFAWCYTFDYK